MASFLVLTACSDDDNSRNNNNEPSDKPPVNLSAAPIAVNTISNEWYKAAETTVTSSIEYNPQRGKAKNIILFVGDGMGISTVTASRILDGQEKGMMGEENSLSFGQFPYVGLAKTYNVDAQTPDSAGTMTAMMSGVKTDAGVLGISEDVQRGDCSTAKGKELLTALELAEIAGKSTGIISTARITHATPAASYAKSADRNWEDISDMRDVEGDCEDIALQLVQFEENLENNIDGLDIDGIEVVFGGGRRHFLPKDSAYNSADFDGASDEKEGDRTDDRDLTAEWQAKYPEGQYIIQQSEFDAIDTESTNHVFGLFDESHMHYEADRENDKAGEPSLSQMTEKAIKILDNNDKGFFLTIESGRIDHAHHAGNAHDALVDTIEFSKAVQAALDNTNPEDTLIIVTADHSHVFTIAGYPKRGNPILGKVVAVGETEPALALDQKPYTTVGYTNGLGYFDLADETDADQSYYTAAVLDANGDDSYITERRADLSAVNTESTGFHQEALIPTQSETHAGEDVGIYATGPGASLVTGTNEQNIIFHIMDFAGDLTSKANAAVMQ